MLLRAPRTEAELEERLVALGYRRVTAVATVARCRELAYVGDERYARERARSLRARGHGSERIAADLAARGLAGGLIDAAVEESREGEREIEWARRALGRGRQRKGAAAWRFLAGRGFPEEVIGDLLGDPS
jgi:SOS response regulatory protein OraA/RecX